MYRANTILGKAIINQATGEHLAAVGDIVFSADGRSVVALLTDTKGLFSHPKVIPWSAIESIGDVVVANSEEPFRHVYDDSEVDTLAREAARITGRPVISPQGARIGAVADVLLNDDGTVTGYEVKRDGLFRQPKFLSIQAVNTIGRDAIIGDETALTSMSSAVEARG